MIAKLQPARWAKLPHRETRRDGPRGLLVQEGWRTSAPVHRREQDVGSPGSGGRSRLSEASLDPRAIPARPLFGGGTDLVTKDDSASSGTWWRRRSRRGLIQYRLPRNSVGEPTKGALIGAMDDVGSPEIRWRSRQKEC